MSLAKFTNHISRIAYHIVHCMSHLTLHTTPYTTYHTLHYEWHLALAQFCSPTAKGSSKVPGLFWFFGACVFVSPIPGPRDWNPTGSLLGITYHVFAYISNLTLHNQILNYTSRLALPITSCISHLHPRKAQINAHFRKTCFLSGFFSNWAQFPLCVFKRKFWWYFLGAWE